MVKVKRSLTTAVRRCCRNGHRAAIFADGTVMEAVSVNDVVARSNGRGGWEYRIAYVDDPQVTTVQMQELFDNHAALEAEHDAVIRALELQAEHEEE